jgi:hypothetical protein
MLFWIHLIAVSEWLNRRFDVILNKVPHLRTNGFVFWRQSEINHVLPPYISSFERAIHCDANTCYLILPHRDQSRRLRNPHQAEKPFSLTL